jgi:1-deoxy-D-xylulose-5-phosphate reductoisomerase
MIGTIAVLGSTGSIGLQTLDVARELGLKVAAISANKNISVIMNQIKEFSPCLVSMGDDNAAIELARRVKESGFKTEVLSGEKGNQAVAEMSETDMVVAAMVGIAGLKPVVCAIRAGKDIALANKETLVAAGHIVMREIKEKEVSIFPVDSEHSAIWQCLHDHHTNDISRIFLTASGGPFRGKCLQELKEVTLSSALAHPTWNMGGKITIDSATMMNKGLEVIEACWLFGVDSLQIQVVVHPQSIVHSMVEFIDGSVLAQLGFPDMKLPIRIALMKKKRIKGRFLPFDPFIANKLTFEKPDAKAFPCLRLAFDAHRCGGSMAAVMNSANEKAVELFMKEMISFNDIPIHIENVMEEHIKKNFVRNPSLDDIFDLDRWATNAVTRLATGHNNK